MIKNFTPEMAETADNYIRDLNERYEDGRLPQA
jgi:hypothetical protein